MKYSVNLSMMFAEYSILDRPRFARDAGCSAVELWWPFDESEPSQTQVDWLVAALENAGLSLACLNFYAGDMAAGDRGVVSHPSHQRQFQANVDVATDIASRTGCKVLNALYGNRLEDVPRESQDEVALENLAFAARSAELVGATVVVEPLNTFENPGYPLVCTVDALRLIDQLAASGYQLGVLYDIYHAQRMEGNLIATIREHVAHFAHVQIADSPSRNEPGTGEIAFPRVLAALRDTGYEGYVGLEYIPTTNSHDSLAWTLSQLEQ